MINLVKDVDKLWRFTSTGVDIDHNRFGINRTNYMHWLETMIDKWLFTPEAKDMAYKALGEARLESGRRDSLYYNLKSKVREPFFDDR